MPCASQPKTLNLVTLTHPHANPLHHHVVSVNLIPLIILTTFIIINKVTLAAALVVAHPVVIGITMTEAVVIPLILAMTPLSGIMISPPALQKPFLIANWQIPL